MFRYLSNVSIFLLSMASICFFISIYTYYSTWKTTEWPSVDGKIYYVLTDSKGMATGIKREVYKVDTQVIRYNYYVDRGLKEGSYSGVSIYNANKNIKKGDVVKVFYNPDKPYVNTLIVGVNWYSVFLFVFFGMVIGIVFLLGVFFKHPLFIRRKINRINRESIGSD